MRECLNVFVCVRIVGVSFVCMPVCPCVCVRVCFVFVRLCACVAADLYESVSMCVGRLRVSLCALLFLCAAGLHWPKPLNEREHVRPPGICDLAVQPHLSSGCSKRRQLD